MPNPNDDTRPAATLSSANKAPNQRKPAPFVWMRPDRPPLTSPMLQNRKLDVPMTSRRATRRP